MTPEDQKNDLFDKKCHQMLDLALHEMKHYAQHGGKIIFTINKPILMERRKIKVSPFKEIEGHI